MTTPDEDERWIRESLARRELDRCAPQTCSSPQILHNAS
jgi:hypothetical protein